MLSALIKLKCPKCHEGNLFINPNPYILSTIDKMPKVCPCCDQPFEPEPGFYYGAMYISYGIGVVLFLTSFFLMEVLLQVSGYLFLGFYICSLLTLWPVVFRYSRVIYIYLFVRYDSKIISKCKKTEG